MKFLLILSLIIVIIDSKCGDTSYYCNDMEMFNRCNDAQEQINDYVNKASSMNKDCKLDLYTPKLFCDQSITCYSQKYGFCQNMDSYDKCQSAPMKLNTFIEKVSSCVNITIDKPTFYCHMDKDVNNYYESSGNLLKSTISLVLLAISLMVI